MKAKKKEKSLLLRLSTPEYKRDAYGFAVRPQHLQRYREYANIYKEEEEERSERWKGFLERCAATESPKIHPEATNEEEGNLAKDQNGELGTSEEISSNDVESKSPDSLEKEKSREKLEIWTEIRPSLDAIDYMMSFRVKGEKVASSKENSMGRSGSRKQLNSIEEMEKANKESSDDEFFEVERLDATSESSTNKNSNNDLAEPHFPWKEELESLVRGGVPMALRGELWQAFVGVRTRKIDGYYQSLLNADDSNATEKEPNGLHESIPKKPEKWKLQIEKDLPRTFPGHPALDEDGRNALRRILTAYARHNPSVGYCQAMNFFAGLLLLLMPEENAFWAFLGIIDDYFDGYYSEEMIESQVDQLVFEEIVRERFPKLVNHLDYLGVEVAWITGAWFLSIFINMLPWESVLRVWDVLLFDGNRVMLFRTALSLLELYGPALVTTKDAGDAITLLQSLAGSTFDSSQLVLTACMGYQAINEMKLQGLRDKHRPDVLDTMEERFQGQPVKDSKGLATKLYSFKHDPESLLPDTNSNGETEIHTNGDLYLLEPGKIDVELDSLPDLQEQVTWLKVELCQLLEEKRSATLRAEELETALMEMVKQDNRHILSAKVEQLEQEVAELRKTLSEKQEQENAMLGVLMRMEQEQKVAEDARISAEQDAAAQRYAANVLQEKYEEALILYAQMEKRAVMAETMLEATIQYQSSQLKAHQTAISPRTPQQESPQEPAQKVGLFSRWRDKNKGKPSSSEESSVGKSSTDGEENASTPVKESGDQQ